jgi:hypothetical protein
MNNETLAETAERALVEFRRELMSRGPDGIDLLAVEEDAIDLVKAWGRAIVQEAMKRADAYGPEVVINGERWGNRRMQSGRYTTVFGEIALERGSYQKSGRGRVAIPMDLKLGIFEGAYTPKVARILDKAIGLMPEAEAENFLHEVGLATVSKSTLHRLPRAIAARYETRRPVIDAAVRERDEIPEQAVTIQVGLDGVMVPQDGEHARPRGRRTDEPDPPRHEQRYGRTGATPVTADDGVEGRSWHEGSVGTIAYFDAEGNRLKTTYLARMPEPYKETLVGQLAEEMLAVVAERPAINIVFASDGAAAQWNALKSLRKKLPTGFSGHTMWVVDFFHVAEYLQVAANAIHGQNAPRAKILAAEWRETLKTEDNGVRAVLKAMRYQRDKMEPNAASRPDLVSSIKFLARQHRRGRMKYAEAERRKYPIGTGITEAAAKTVVNVRMKRAGARFSQHGGQTVMLFRTAVLSNRFDLLHDEIQATYRAKIAA